MIFTSRGPGVLCRKTAATNAASTSSWQYTIWPEASPSAQGIRSISLTVDPIDHVFVMRRKNWPPVDQ